MAKKLEIQDQYTHLSYPQIWNAWSIKQRLHFLDDHRHKIPGADELPNRAEWAELDFARLAQNIQSIFAQHVEHGQYGKGGSLPSKIRIIEDKVMPFEDEPNRIVHHITGIYKDYYFQAKTDNSYLFGYNSTNIGKRSIYKLRIDKLTFDPDLVTSLINRMDYPQYEPNPIAIFEDDEWKIKKLDTASDKEAIKIIIQHLEDIALSKGSQKEEYESGGPLSHQNIIASGTMNTQDGEIEGCVRWNDYWEKYQVSIDGEPSGEFDDPESAIGELNRAGFSNVVKYEKGGQVDGPTVEGITVYPWIRPKDYEQGETVVVHYNSAPQITKVKTVDGNDYYTMENGAQYYYDEIVPTKLKYEKGGSLSSIESEIKAALDALHKNGIENYNSEAATQAENAIFNKLYKQYGYNPDDDANQADYQYNLKATDEERLQYLLDTVLPRLRKSPEETMHTILTSLNQQPLAKDIRAQIATMLATPSIAKLPASNPKVKKLVAKLKDKYALAFEAPYTREELESAILGFKILADDGDEVAKAKIADLQALLDEMVEKKEDGGLIVTHVQYESAVLETVGNNNYLRINGDSWKLTDDQLADLLRELEAVNQNPLSAAEYLLKLDKSKFESITKKEKGGPLIASKTNAVELYAYLDNTDVKAKPVYVIKQGFLFKITKNPEEAYQFKSEEEIEKAIAALSKKYKDVAWVKQHCEFEKVDKFGKGGPTGNAVNPKKAIDYALAMVERNKKYADLNKRILAKKKEIEQNDKKKRSKNKKIHIAAINKASYLQRELEKMDNEEREEISASTGLDGYDLTERANGEMIQIYDLHMNGSNPTWLKKFIEEEESFGAPKTKPASKPKFKKS